MPPGGRAPGGKGAGGVIALIVALLVVGAVGYFGWQYVQARGARATDSETGCLTNSPTPQAVLFLVDATDRLSREHAQRIKSRINDVVAELPRYSRVTIVPFGGDTAAPLLPIFNKCLPGRSETANLDEGSQLLEEEYQAFRQALDGMIGRLESLPDSRTSPITDQVVRAASDPQLHWQGTARMLVLITDGLESSIYWTRNLRLPDPPEGLLRGARAEFFEVGNARGNRLQTQAMRLEWKSWLERAGAEVRISAPGFPASTP
ncbi:MAG TPA: vWA domain-containing protein [Allosphingosinicella sp.]